MSATDHLKLFASLWKNKYGRPYPIAWKKDTVLMARLLKDYSDEDLRAFIKHYLVTDTDPFCVRVGYTLEFFVKRIPSIVAALDSRETKVKQNDEDFNRLEEARSKLREKTKRHKDR